MWKQEKILSTSHRYTDIGLLIMRITIGGSLVLKHGIEKAFQFQTMVHNVHPRFPDPIHIGKVPSLVIALLSDFLAGIFVILGMGTRFAAAFAFVNITVAWITVHHFAFFDPKGGDHGEIVVMMMGSMLAFVFTGAGKYSIDYLATRPRHS